jgi:hypothetical protein
MGSGHWGGLRARALTGMALSRVGSWLTGSTPGVLILSHSHSSHLLQLLKKYAIVTNDRHCIY